MSIDYIFIASILFYAFMAQTFSTHDFSVKLASIVTIGAPYLFQKILKLILINTQHAGLSNLFTINDVALFAAQLFAAFIIFSKLRTNEDILDTWLLWVAGGAVGIYFVIPYVVNLIPF